MTASLRDVGHARAASRRPRAERDIKRSMSNAIETACPPTALRLRSNRTSHVHRQLSRRMLHDLSQCAEGPRDGLMRATQRGEQIFDRHPLAVVRINKPRLDPAV